MPRFDRILVDPTHDELVRTLEAASNILSGFFRRGSPLVALPVPVQIPVIGPQIPTTAEGWQQWDFPVLGSASGSWDYLGVAWWTDHIGRRHYRIVSQRSGHVGPASPNFLCLYGEPRPPLWLVYPGHAFLRRRGERRELAVTCRCGVVGMPGDVAWMGDCCGPCYDRCESGIQPPRLAEKTTFSVLEEGTSIRVFLTLSPDGRLLAAGTGRGGLHVWEIETGRQLVAATERSLGSWTCAAFVPDGRTLTAARYGGDPGLHQFDVPTWQRRSTLSVLEWGNRLVYSPDGSLVGGVANSRLRLLQVATGHTRLGFLRAGLSETSCLAFSPDSRTVASAGSSGSILLGDVTTGQEKTGLNLPDHLVTSLAFSPDGDTLAIGTIRTEEIGSVPLAERGRVYLWNVERSKGHTTLPGHGIGTLAVAYSPDGSVLVTGGCDRMVRLWDLDSGRERCALEWHFADVRQLCFSADGRWLGSMSEDGAIKLWPWRELLQG